jgi:hypothetical protein
MYRPRFFNQLSQLPHERTCPMGLRRDFLQRTTDTVHWSIAAF